MTVELEQTLAENLKVFSPENIARELFDINKLYDKYNKELLIYINSIDERLIDLDELYKDVYYDCLTRPGGLDFFSRYGYVMMQVAKKLIIIKNQWTIYQIKFQTFLNHLKSKTTQFMQLTS